MARSQPVLRIKGLKVLTIGRFNQPDIPNHRLLVISHLLIIPVDQQGPTTLTPGELLIKEYADKYGLLRKQQETSRVQRAVLPIGSSGLIGDWPRPGGLASVPVAPILFGMPVTDREEIVEFRDQVWKLGIGMAGVLKGRSECLAGADDIVLRKFRGKNVTFVITWPGYEKHQSTPIHTQLEKGDPITRLDLARQITMAYAKFFKKVEDERMLPEKVGFYNIALHQGKNAREDSLGVQLTQLHLVKFYNTTVGYFVAEVDIV